MDLTTALQQSRTAIHRSERGTVLVEDNTHVDNGYSIDLNPDPHANVERTSHYNLPWISPTEVIAADDLPELLLKLDTYGLKDAPDWEPIS